MPDFTSRNARFYLKINAILRIPNTNVVFPLLINMNVRLEHLEILPLI